MIASALPQKSLRRTGLPSGKSGDVRFVQEAAHRTMRRDKSQKG